MRTAGPSAVISRRDNFYIEPYWWGQYFTPEMFDLERVLADFAELFRAVWRAIPARDRRTLRDYWRRKRDRMGAGARFPQIQVRERLILRDGTHLHGLCEFDGLGLAFSLSSILSSQDKMPYVVAHELAHAFRYATGEHQRLEEPMRVEIDQLMERARNKSISYRTYKRKRLEVSRSYNELHEAPTDAVAERWGFPSPD
jgi:hypothetical protein